MCIIIDFYYKMGKSKKSKKESPVVLPVIKSTSLPLKEMKAEAGKMADFKRWMAMEMKSSSVLAYAAASVVYRS